MTTQERKLEEVVLWTRSLEELNSRNPNKRYKASGTLPFYSNSYSIYNDWDEAIKRELREKGCDGLVNCCSIFGDVRNTLSSAAVEGTPIVRVKK